MENKEREREREEINYSSLYEEQMAVGHTVYGKERIFLFRERDERQGDGKNADRRLEGSSGNRIRTCGGFGALQEVCGAFSAAVAVISFYMSSGSMDGKSKADTYRAVRRAAEIFEQEYGAIRCKEILHGNAPKAFQCGMKVKDAVLVVHKVLAEEAARKEAVRNSAAG